MAYGEARLVMEQTPREIIEFVLDLREYQTEPVGVIDAPVVSGRGIVRAAQGLVLTASP
ncbi:hypothetical protein [Nocardiopsis halotolerans]|uniref:hypothetical protein n=1 Tax=Nocardiopsis halotolerans TaxID=124252 RepID=UPI00034D5E60|nr:hypothetical protein [Nocardiopsis halotolerans]